jgi:hypothetical protein
MSIIPLDLERRFEQRWAARFLRPLAGLLKLAERETALNEGMAVAKAKENDERLLLDGNTRIG